VNGTRFPTLPDLLRVGLNVVFVNINPSVYSAERGHYFARRSNKFWPCVSRSVLTREAREALGVARLTPEHDVFLPEYGIGFTDVVKRATARASDLAPSELAAAVHALLEKVERYQPRVACFQGMTAFRPVHRELLGDAPPPALGAQQLRLGTTRVFVVPNPSGANAHYTREEQTAWYDALAAAAAGRLTSLTN
jgi:double-stranded uracil-DNA glycosylase